MQKILIFGVHCYNREWEIENYSFLFLLFFSFIYFASQSHAIIAQLVERSHGKAEVSGSNPDGGSIL